MLREMIDSKELEIKNVSVVESAPVRDALDDNNTDNRRLICESSTDKKFLTLLCFYGCVPWNPEKGNWINIMCLSWFVIAKLSILTLCIYIICQWINFLHFVTDTGMAFLMTISYLSSFTSYVVYVVPRWFEFMTPIPFEISLLVKSRQSSRFSDNRDDNRDSRLKAEFIIRYADSFRTNPESNQLSFAYMSVIFFIIATIITEVAESLDLVYGYHSVINNFYPSIHYPLTFTGQFFVGGCQAGFLAIFLYRLNIAQNLLIAAKKKLESHSLTMTDIDTLRDDFDILFGKKGSTENTFYGIVINSGVISIVAAMIRFIVTLDIFGIFNAIVYFGKTIIFAVVIFRTAGQLNSLCNELKRNVSKENLKKDIEQALVAISLQGDPLNISFFGVEPSESLYLWQLFGVTITFGFRLLHGLVGL